MPADCNRAVEICQTEAGFVAQTAVRNEWRYARATALRRLRQFMDNRVSAAAGVSTRQPLVLFQEAHGRWHTRIGLCGPESSIVVLSARRGKVRVQPVPPQTVAVLRLEGAAGPAQIAQGLSAIEDTLAATPWQVSGCPVLRMHLRPSLLSFRPRVEVAAPVTLRPTERDR